ncbi:MAG: Tetraacyldisaccharide 4-kinase [Gemmatimonadetes bacterium]|nr:Tetraacyldisaccharide 4-kinase [Gemmatimonadota bacterium]
MTHRGIERIWYGDDLLARSTRTALSAGSAAVAGVAALRNAMFDRGILRTIEPPVPALSLGNLSVGGTGKTPVAAWAARALRARGARPAIVLRGYGGDEPLVHARLNPDVPVVADPDRVRGAATAAEGGAVCVVLDDAFLHRRIARVADWVLVAADDWHDDARVLPAGPLRETTAALRRASVVVVTRKSASLDAAEALGQRLARRVRGGAWAVVHLAPGALVAPDGTRATLDALRGRRFLAVAAIGAPGPFFAQLRALGAELVEAPFRDHHGFSAADAASLAHRARGMDGVVCTLKDAVKLAPLWRGADTPLWYVSQAAAVDRGRTHLDASLEAVLTARVHPL